MASDSLRLRPSFHFTVSIILALLREFGYVCTSPFENITLEEGSSNLSLFCIFYLSHIGKRIEERYQNRMPNSFLAYRFLNIKDKIGFSMWKHIFHNLFIISYFHCSNKRIKGINFIYFNDVSNDWNCNKKNNVCILIRILPLFDLSIRWETEVHLGALLVLEYLKIQWNCIHQSTIQERYPCSIGILFRVENFARRFQGDN